MAKYRALAPLYVPLGGYVEVGQIIATDGTGDVPIPSNFVPTVACDPLDAPAIAALTATFVGQLATPTQATQPSPSTGVLGLWGIRTQFSTLPLPAPSAAWRALIHP
jgi:hypothetical protein